MSALANDNKGKSPKNPFGGKKRPTNQPTSWPTHICHYLEFIFRIYFKTFDKYLELFQKKKISKLNLD